MPAGFSVDQLYIYLNVIAASSYTTFEHIPNPEITAELLYFDGLTLVGVSSGAGDHDVWRSFRSEMDRLFDQFSGAFGMPTLRRMLTTEPSWRAGGAFDLLRRPWISQRGRQGL
jgi:hypothetical protein